MSKKRGLSLEEKRKRMLDLFMEKKEFFHLKEVEKLAPKLKGITPMSVKEVLQSLVDDDMVDSEKVGSSTYYWAFPSKALNVRTQKLQNLKRVLKESENELQFCQTDVLTAKKSRKDSDDREKILEELVTLTSERDELKLELSKLKDYDPKVLQQMQNETVIAKEAANRWTDNIFSLKSWIKKKFPVDENQINKQFEIPDDLDYIT